MRYLRQSLHEYAPGFRQSHAAETALEYPETAIGLDGIQLLNERRTRNVKLFGRLRKTPLLGQHLQPLQQHEIEHENRLLFD